MRRDDTTNAMTPFNVEPIKKKKKPFDDVAHLMIEPP